MLKKYLGAFLVAILLLPAVPAFADRGPRRDFHGGKNFHREYVVHRIGPGYIPLIAGGLALLYSEGMFYRYTRAGYIVVTPPMGAVVPALPPGYTMVYANGMPYYYYGYTYYSPVPNGYVVAAPPVIPAAPPVAPPMIAQSPVAAAPAAAPAASQSAVANPAPDTNRDVYDIYIPNGNGSYTSITLRKTEKGFLGPQGEFYVDHPTVEQLRERYTKK